MSWPKKASKVPTDITEDTIRAVCLPMGLVDVTYAPIFARFCGLEQFHGWSVPAELDVLAAWIATLVTDPVVLETRGPEDELLEILEGYRENYRRVAALR